MLKPLELGDGVVLLRPYQPADANLLYIAVRESLAEMTPWMPWCHSNYSLQESQEWIAQRKDKWESGTEYDFAIIDYQDKSFLGGCGINGIKDNLRIANLGYWVRTSQTRRGVATRAAKLLAHFGIQDLKLNRIEIVVAIGNLPSQRVAQKLGALREGIERNRIIVNGKPSDAVMFSIIPQDFINQK